MSQRSRTFTTLKSEVDDQRLLEFSDEMIQALETEIDQAFQARGRGAGTRLSLSWHGPELWIVVRHGEPLKRTTCLREGAPSTLLFRPEGCDFLVMNPERGELRLNRMSHWQQELYRRALGRHLYGSEELFLTHDRYTLEPLRREGTRSLVCSDQLELAEVRLTEIRYLDPGAGELETKLAADDLFVSGFDFAELPMAVQLMSAKFSVRILHAKSWRTVTVTTPNQLRCALESDSEVIEAWLEKRGFLIRNEDNDEFGDIESILAFPRIPAESDSDCSRMATRSGT